MQLSIGGCIILWNMTIIFKYGIEFFLGLFPIASSVNYILLNIHCCYFLNLKLSCVNMSSLCFNLVVPMGASISRYASHFDFKSR